MMGDDSTTCWQLPETSIGGGENANGNVNQGGIEGLGGRETWGGENKSVAIS